MFSAIGFTPISQISETMPTFAEFAKMWDDEKSISRIRNFSPSDFMENRLFSVVFANTNPFLCSPQGHVVEFASRDLFDKIEWPDELTKHLLDDEYAQLQLASGYIEKETSEKIWGPGISPPPRSSLPLFFLRGVYVVSLQNYLTLRRVALKEYTEDELHDAVALSFEIDPVYQVIEQFEGWSICIPNDKVKPPQSWFEDTSPGNWHSENGTKRVSQAELVRKILDGFRENKFSTKQEAFTLYGQSSSIRGFGMAWANAAQTEPQLSKPGRKKDR